MSRNLLSLLLCLCTLIIPRALQAADEFFALLKPLPPTVFESRYLNAVKEGKVYRLRTHSQPSSVIADRKVYWNDDPVGHFAVHFLDQAAKGKALTLSLKDDGGKSVHETRIPALKEAKLEAVLRIGSLAPGKYRLEATLAADTPVTVGVDFARADRAGSQIKIPAAGIEIEVTPQKHLKTASCPITTGIPLPKGAVADASKLAVYENGKEVPCQIAALEHWHRDLSNVPASVSWAHLSFIARYEGGKPLRYRLKLKSGKRMTPAKPVQVKATEGKITVTTGTLRFVIGRKRFTGIDSAWIDKNGDKSYTDEERLVWSTKTRPGGPFIVDSRGLRFESALDTAPEVKVEEAGPLKAVISASGWLVRPGKTSRFDSTKLCRFVTKFIAWAGREEIQVEHRTLVTFDTDTHRLNEVGFHIPTIEANGWALGMDGKTIGDSRFVKGKPTSLHQYRWDRLRVLNFPKTESYRGKMIITGEEKTGKKSDGWGSLIFGKEEAGTDGGGDELDIEDMELDDPRVLLTAEVRNIWQKFPKELALGENGITVYTWPAHGKLTFDDSEMYEWKDIYKLRYFHHGKLLDLRFPSKAYSILNRHNFLESEPSDEAALHANGQGVALASTFRLRFHNIEPEQRGEQAALFQQPPHARSPGEWNTATGFMGPVAAVDRKNFPEVEKDLDTVFADYMRVVVDGTHEYGMFIHCNTHNNWDAKERRAELHRAWKGGEYSHVQEPWLMYYRGNSPSLLPWARALSDNYMDCHTVNYADPEKPLQWHTPGSMYHTKGFVPWGATRYGMRATVTYAGNIGHWIDATGHLRRWQYEGNYRARDLMQLWISSLKKRRIFTGGSRETSGIAPTIIPGSISSGPIKCLSTAATRASLSGSKSMWGTAAGRALRPCALSW
ncbi:MAG: exo-rhamnogalacturonan lyase family protein [Planctomycetota bacterium]|jgi:hypothetical protein